MSFLFPIQSEGAIVLTADELSDDMLIVQIVTPGAQLSCTTLGALKAYIRGATGLINNNGFLLLDGPQPGWPTSDAGLPPGSYFANGLFVNVTPGGIASGAPLIFADVTAGLLLSIGTGPLINSPQVPGSGQLFINGGYVCIA